MAKIYDHAHANKMAARGMAAADFGTTIAPAAGSGRRGGAPLKQATPMHAGNLTAPRFTSQGRAAAARKFSKARRLKGPSMSNFSSPPSKLYGAATRFGPKKGN